MNSIIKQIKPKYKLLNNYLIRGAKVLDIGIDNNSYIELKSIFPGTKYTGIDYKKIDYTMDSGDNFYLIDLNLRLPSEEIKTTKFDVIVLNHVIEHLTNGHDVFVDLISLIKPGGVMYVEFPSIRTAQKSVLGNYHFHDDVTHKKFYDVFDLSNLALANNCKIITCGPISTLLKDMLSIPRAFQSLILKKKIGAELIFLQRKIDHIMIRKNQ